MILTPKSFRNMVQVKNKTTIKIMKINKIEHKRIKKMKINTLMKVCKILMKEQITNSCQKWQDKFSSKWNNQVNKNKLNYQKLHMLNTLISSFHCTNIREMHLQPFSFPFFSFLFSVLPSSSKKINYQTELDQSPLWFLVTLLWFHLLNNNYLHLLELLSFK